MSWREPVDISYRGKCPVPELCQRVIATLCLNDRQALLRYVRRLMGSKEGCEDIVQEALLRTFERSQRVTEPRAFAFTVARNLTADRQRHLRLAKTDTLGDLSDSPVMATQDTVEGTVLEQEESKLLREAIEQLSPQCRTAFTLRLLEGRPYKEIAQQMGLSPKTVENHIARALRETQEFLRVRYQIR